MNYDFLQPAREAQATIDSRVDELMVESIESCFMNRKMRTDYILEEAKRDIAECCTIQWTRRIAHTDGGSINAF